jgi:hypothetical protein
MQRLSPEEDLQQQDLGQKRHRFQANIEPTADTKHTPEKGGSFPASVGRWWWALAAAVVAPWWNLPIDNADGAGMLAHLQGFFVDLDLLYDDEYAALRMSPLFAFVTSQGVISNHWPTGATWIQAPGFGLGAIVGEILRVLELPGGNAPWTIRLLGLHTWAMTLLVWLARELARWVGGREGVLYAACFVVGTPLLYYASEAPARPHLYGACVVFLVVRLWQGERWAGALGRTAILGLLVGLAASIRPQLATLGLLVVHDVWTRSPAPERRRRLAIGVAACAAWPLTNLALQWWMYGEDLAHYFGGGVSHHLGHFLLSHYHGVLWWTPLVFVGLAGLGLGVARRRSGAWLLLALVLAQLWTDSGYRPIEPGHVLGTRTWAGGTSFGPRKLVDVLPLLLPGLLWLRDEAAARGDAWRRGLAGVVVASSLPVAWLHLSLWLDPSGAERVLDGADYWALFAVPFDGQRWSIALGQRSLAASVSVALAIGVGAPAVLGGAWAWRRLRVASVRVVAGLILGGCLFAHLWLAVLQARTDAELAEDPERSTELARALNPVHAATVARTAAHRQRLRGRLGDDAAPGPE